MGVLEQTQDWVHGSLRDPLGRFCGVRPWYKECVPPFKCILESGASIGLRTNSVNVNLEQETEDYEVSLLEQWVQKIPLWKILARAIMIHRKMEEDPLRFASNLTPTDVKNISSVLGKESASMLEQFVAKLKLSFSKMDSGSDNIAAEKFMTFTADCGVAKDFHGGLMKRIGC